MQHPLEVYWIIGGLSALFMSLLAYLNSRVSSHRNDIVDIINKHEHREDKVFDELKDHLESLRDDMVSIKIDLASIKRATNGKSA